MNRISLLFIGLLIAGSLVAQNRINYTNTAPEIDGFTDDVWEIARVYPIDKPFITETPTVTATWQALYDDENFYVLVTVEDDDHWPGWQANGESTQYDMPEIYWDVNEVLDDGKGAKDVGSGHYQFADGFADGRYDEPITKAPNGSNPGGTYAYSLIGEGYVYELAVPLANLKDYQGIALNPYSRDNFGFDVTVIDQDEKISTKPQRCVWSNDGNGNNGSSDESWNNMDGAGDVALGTPGDPIYWYYPELYASSYSISLSADSLANASIKVYANMTWQAESNQSWLIISQSSHYGSGTLNYRVSKNFGETRNATITINGGYKSMKIKIFITQLGSGVSIRDGIEFKRDFISYCVNDNLYFKDNIDRIKLFNSLGALVKETTVNGKAVSVAELPNGIYIVKAYKKGQFEGVGKIIKN